MGIKKKLALGVASAALGLSLIGGGTWATFNDIKTVDNTFAAGIVKLGVNPATQVFNVSNLAPGDFMTRNFDIINQGNIEISKVNMKISYTVKDGNNAPVVGVEADNFADQFTVNFLTNDGMPVGGGLLPFPVNGGTLQGKSLKDIAAQSSVDITKAFWLLGSTDNKLVVGGTDHMSMKLTFESLTQMDANGFYLQNKYQGWTIVPTITLEAVQRAGMNR